MKTIKLILLLLLPACAARASAQGLPFEDKAKYEKVLEQKVDDVLVRLLGPNQAKVVVEATMDFTRTEKLDINPAADKTKADQFKWQSIGGDSMASDYLMPGFPLLSAGEEQSKSYNKQTSFPSAIVKRLNVTVLLNKDVPEVAAQNIKIVVSDLLMVSSARGDAVSIIRAPFAPLWKTIWYTPETLSLVVKYIILSVMGIVGIIVVAVGFLKLADAMSTMAKVQQNHQISMDFGKGGEGGAPGEGGGTPLLGAGAGKAPGKEAAEEAGQEANGKVVFNVRKDQVPFLISMMLKEDPANVALVATHLEPEVRSEFLRAMPSDFSSEIIASMANVRFMEPDVITALKDELERRLSGAVGGVEKVLEALENVGLSVKKSMLKQLEEKHPDLAREVKGRILLFEDLGKLEDREMSLLASSVKIEDWSAVIWDMPELFKGRLRTQMAEKTWRMLEESAKYGMPSREKIDAAAETVMAVAVKLISEGRVVNPLTRPAAPAAIEQAPA